MAREQPHREEPGLQPSRVSLLTGRTLFILAVLIVMSAIVAVGLFLQPASADQLLRQARKLELSDPQRALVLLENCIRSSQGDFPAAQLLQCRILSSQRRFQEAIDCFKRIRHPAACPLEELTSLAQSAHATGQLSLAELAFDAAGDSIRTQARLLRSLIEVKYSLNRRLVTLDLCRDYARLAPRDPYPWLVSAGIHHTNQNSTEAIRDYHEALTRNLPDQEAARVRYQLVGLLMDVGDLAEARRQCDLLLAGSVAPESREFVRLRNADLLRREGKSAEALAVVTAVLSEHPDSMTAVVIRGYLNFETGNYQQAIDDLRLVVDRDPYHQSAHYKLGQAYLRHGQPDQAAVHLRRSQELIELSAAILATENQLNNVPDDRGLVKKLAELNALRGNSQATAP